jgi:hypothetical protein
MEQMRFWGKKRLFKTPRLRKIILSERGIFEPALREEDVLGEIHSMLWACGIPVFRERERIPKVRAHCDRCRNVFDVWVGKPSEAGHPDLHGHIPIHAVIRFAASQELREWACAQLRFPIPFYIETKRPKGGVHRPAQEAFIARANEHHALALFARSWKEVIKGFQSIGLTLPEGNSGISRPEVPSQARTERDVPAVATHRRVQKPDEPGAPKGQAHAA